jgi:uncharacterized membrane protein (DUF2068 family)
MKGTSSHLAPKDRHKHRAGLVLIAAYKLLGALFFVAIGVGALRLLHKDIGDVLWHELIEVLRMNPESRVVNFIFAKAQLLNDPVLRRIGLAAFCYAAVGILEAIGLYLEKVWGETLTLVITASFLPFELHEIWRRVTWVRVSVFAVNLAVLVYLFWLLGERAAQRRHRAVTTRS